MNTEKSILRITALLALFALAFAAIGCEVVESSHYLLTFAVVKGLGVAALAAGVKLYGFWKNDPVINIYERWATSAEQECC